MRNTSGTFRQVLPGTCWTTVDGNQLSSLPLSSIGALHTIGTGAGDLWGMWKKNILVICNDRYRLPKLERLTFPWTRH